MLNQAPNVKLPIAIIGLGYVGLPLAVAMAAKYQVVGFDIDAQRVSDLANGADHTLQCTKEEITAVKQLSFSNTVKEIAHCGIYIITVPTPVDANKLPDLNFLLNATTMVGALLKQGDIVIYESTVYPGCTEEECVPVLERVSGLQFNKDFYCGYSPERINPGDKVNTITKIKKERNKGQ